MSMSNTQYLPRYAKRAAGKTTPRPGPSTRDNKRAYCATGFLTRSTRLLARTDGRRRKGSYNKQLRHGTKQNEKGEKASMHATKRPLNKFS